jgi:hypothetical protein
MKTIDLAMTVDGPVHEAQTRIHDSVDERLRSAGYAGREMAGTLEYRPAYTFPFFFWLVRRSLQHVTFTFAQQGPATEVRATGRLSDRAHTEVTEALGGD